jgi:hypothetical protein
VSTRESDTVTAIASIAAVTIIVSVACITGHDDTLIKIGLATVAGLGGFTLRSLIRRQP